MEFPWCLLQIVVEDSEEEMLSFLLLSRLLGVEGIQDKYL